MLIVDRVSKSYRGTDVRGRNESVLKSVSLQVRDGDSVSLVGESGSGKSTLGRLILGLERPDSGRLTWNGQSVFARQYRKKELYQEIQPVFQDNSGCFNPRWKIRASLLEPMRNYLHPGGREMERQVKYLLELVGLSSSVLDKYPHELSGGQQKRVCIARAISIRPRFVLLDEAVSGLDATVMLKILRLLKNIQKEIGCSYLFITHDVKAAFFMSATLAVMQGGTIVETIENTTGPNDFSHPHSRTLMQNLFKEN
ncbi:Nickel-transporting ATPase [Syntrophobotulus glycolicus DSM 8271]|uniref:Nickel-transporting ATPase n=1 Tax=Syntrophobotulus glycolicus (strain DSM 8271 / FlGlyR) TaxID=645991 RepID=F0SZM7_SYNGF|nr:dipeptide/oligopeptide/nickel ABC transporter ATP-binding protein [Syntrophobotulus glycolicus]ADY56113.1 Nickel-transporting ATPase [Syntrophobotulus glycolicus DSM 8271]